MGWTVCGAAVLSSGPGPTSGAQTKLGHRVIEFGSNMCCDFAKRSNDRSEPCIKTKRLRIGPRVQHYHTAELDYATRIRVKIGVGGYKQVSLRSSSARSSAADWVGTEKNGVTLTHASSRGIQSRSRNYNSTWAAELYVKGSIGNSERLSKSTLEMYSSRLPVPHGHGFRGNAFFADHILAYRSLAPVQAYRRDLLVHGPVIIPHRLRAPCARSTVGVTTFSHVSPESCLSALTKLTRAS
ncbi:hypothetical protein NMY22_g1178 [Coprinellus aureogranulatus]|nr:hypothetical protein NMY22_g1178 [Coprinellus aureogranulatus]